MFHRKVEIQKLTVQFDWLKALIPE